jgi:hypothetical protein
MLNKQMYETRSGGSYVIFENDIQIDRGLFTDVYLKLFSTVTPFWGNDIFNLNINSETEKALRENSLDVKGKENIKRAIESDLSKINYADFTVELVENNDKLQINITAGNNGVLQIAWDFTENQDITIHTQDTSTGQPLLSKSGFFILTKDGQKITAK